MDQDILSEVFSTLRISSDLYFRASLGGEFAVEVPKERRKIRFHLVREGACWLTVPGTEPVLLSKGDIAIVPDGAEQVLSASAEHSAKPLAEVIAGGALQQGLLRYGRGEAKVNLLCGYCAFDEAMDHPVLTGLPSLIVLRPDELKSEPWAAATLQLLAMEVDLDAPGMMGILSRLLEIVFIQAVRSMTSSSGNTAGFLAALFDSKLSKALHAIHSEPQRGWTIDSLACVAGMSRARFADRFTNIIGIPPITYLTRWRLMKGRVLLSTTNLDMEEIANRCGYASATSFSRRFKETFEIGPGAYRRVGQQV